jgi:hypothetical protein
MLCSPHWQGLLSAAGSWQCASVRCCHCVEGSISEQGALRAVIRAAQSLIVTGLKTCMFEACSKVFAAVLGSPGAVVPSQQGVSQLCMLQLGRAGSAATSQALLQPHKLPSAVSYQAQTPTHWARQAVAWHCPHMSSSSLMVALSTSGMQPF